MVHDFEEVEEDARRGAMRPDDATNSIGFGYAGASGARGGGGDEFTVQSSADYLSSLREAWMKIPKAALKSIGWLDSEDHERSSPGPAIADEFEAWTGRNRKAHGAKGKVDGIGGPYGERYAVSHVSASVVPNFFSSLRVFEYNITGLDNDYVASTPYSIIEPRWDGIQVPLRSDEDGTEDDNVQHAEVLRKKKKKKGPKKYKFTVPEPPSKSAPPGPAYSPQTLSLLGYTQYFANLTFINNDFTKDDGVRAATVDGVDNLTDDADADADDGGAVRTEKWKEGKHKGRKPRKHTPHPNPFRYEVEYSTFNDSIYALRDMSVRSYLDLARRIGDSAKGKGNGNGKKGKGMMSSVWDVVGEEVDDKVAGVAQKGDSLDEDDRDNDHENDDHDRDDENVKHSDDNHENEIEDPEDEQHTSKKKKSPKHGKKHKKKNHKHRKTMTELWYTFLQRAYVSAMDRADLEGQFGGLSGPASSVAYVEGEEQPSALGEGNSGGGAGETVSGGDVVVEESWEEL